MTDYIVTTPEAKQAVFSIRFYQNADGKVIGLGKDKDAGEDFQELMVTIEGHSTGKVLMLASRAADAVALQFPEFFAPYDGKALPGQEATKKHIADAEKKQEFIDANVAKDDDSTEPAQQPYSKKIADAVAKIPTGKLMALYNVVVPSDKPVTKFSTRGNAERRTAMAIEDLQRNDMQVWNNIISAQDADIRTLFADTQDDGLFGTLTLRQKFIIIHLQKFAKVGNGGKKESSDAVAFETEFAKYLSAVQPTLACNIDDKTPVDNAGNLSSVGKTLDFLQGKQIINKQFGLSASANEWIDANASAMDFDAFTVDLQYRDWHSPGRASTFTGKRIMLSAETKSANPRKAGSHGWYSIEILRNADAGHGVGYEYFRSLGGRTTDLQWDINYKRVYIS